MKIVTGTACGATIHAHTKCHASDKPISAITMKLPQLRREYTNTYILYTHVHCGIVYLSLFLILEFPYRQLHSIVQRPLHAQFAVVVVVVAALNMHSINSTPLYILLALRHTHKHTKCHDHDEPLPLPLPLITQSLWLAGWQSFCEIHSAPGSDSPFRPHPHLSRNRQKHVELECIDSGSRSVHTAWKLVRMRVDGFSSRCASRLRVVNTNVSDAELRR